MLSWLIAAGLIVLAVAIVAATLAVILGSDIEGFDG